MKYFILIVISSITLFAQPNDSNRFMLGQNYERAGNFEKALEIYESLYTKQPANQVYFKALNDFYRKIKKYDESAVIIHQQIEMTPGNPALQGELGKTYFLMDNDEKAFEVWDKAVEDYRNIPQIHRTIANYAIEMRAFDKAIEYLLEGREGDRNQVVYAYDLAYLYTLKMQYSEAAEQYAFILDTEPGQLAGIRSRLLSGSSKEDLLSGMIPVFENKNPEENSAYAELLALLYYETKEYQKAFEMNRLLDEQREQNGTIIYQFAQRLYHEGIYTGASDAFQFILDNYPDSPVLSNTKLGFAKTREEELRNEFQKKLPAWKPFFQPLQPDAEPYERVISSYEEIVRQYPGSEVSAEALYRLAEIYRLLGEFEKSVEKLELLTGTMPLSQHYAPALLLLGEIAVREGELEKAKAFFNKARLQKQANIPLYNTAQYNIVLIHFYTGSIDSAKKQLGSITTQLQDDRANDALQLSMLLNPKMNDSLMLLKFAEAELFLRQYRFEDALPLYKETAGDEKSYVLNQIAGLRVIQTLTALGDYTEATALVDSLIARNQNIYSDEALYLQGKIYQYGLQDLEKALAAYEKLLATFPNSLYLDKAREQIIILRKRLS